jgi:hypothetical protein
MGKKFRVWLNSGANIHSTYETTVDLDDWGMSDAEWDELTEKEKEDMMREVAFENSDWGFAEVE